MMVEVTNYVYWECTQTMVKAVIFDLDGTLLNREASVQNFIATQYDRFSKWLDHITKEKYTTRFIELDAQGHVWKDEVYKQLVDEFKIKRLTRECLLQDYRDEFKHSCVSFPNLICMLEALKRESILIGMITNGKSQFQMDNIVSLSIEKYFDTILISETEGIKKPNPAIFKKALKQFNVSAQETIFVGDHPENDVKISRDVGMKGLWKKNIHEPDVVTDNIIGDLSELPLIIRKLIIRKGDFKKYV